MGTWPTPATLKNDFFTAKLNLGKRNPFLIFGNFL